jgi:hypothetical protein
MNIAEKAEYRREGEEARNHIIELGEVGARDLSRDRDAEGEGYGEDLLPEEGHHEGLLYQRWDHGSDYHGALVDSQT